MRVRRILLLACSIIVGATTTAAAQEPEPVGITMGYPAAIGLLWHLSDRVALSPEFSFTLTDSSSESLMNDESHFWSLGTGVSALFYWPATDNLRTYVGAALLLRANQRRQLHHRIDDRCVLVRGNVWRAVLAWPSVRGFRRGRARLLAAEWHGDNEHRQRDNDHHKSRECVWHQDGSRCCTLYF